MYQQRQLQQVKMVEKICILCRRMIGDRDNYIKLEEWNKRRKLKEDFIHKKCWEFFVDEKKQRGFVKKLALGMVGRANRLMDKAEGVTA